MNKQKILIIGAGISGLACAQELVDKGYEIDIVDARGKIGGRIESDDKFTEKIIELGAEEIHSKKSDLYKVFQKHGAEFINTNCYTEIIYDRSRQKFVNDCTFYKRYKKKLSNVFDQLEDYDEISNNISLYDYLQKYHYDEFSYFYEAILGAEYGSTTKLLGAQGIGESEFFFSGTSSYSIQNFSLNQLIQMTFKLIIDKVRLNCPVLGVLLNNDNKVTVTFANNMISSYDIIVCTVPLSQITKIKWSPELPKEKLDIIQNSVCIQKGGKLFLKLNLNPFIYDVGGIILDSMASTYFWNNSNDDVTILTALVTGDAYNFILQNGLEKYIKLIEEQLQTQFKQFNLAIVNYKFKDWGSEKFIEGLYSNPGIGYKSQQRVILSQNIDNKIYFCGEAYHRTHFGTLHGAYETGINTANEINKK